MGENRHARLLLHARDEALAAARDDDVDIAVEPRQHGADGSAVAGRHEAGSHRRAARPLQALAHGLGDRLDVRKLSEPARRIAALPALRQSAPASAVTLGRLSKITPMTPSGVATRSMTRPFGRSKVASTRPTGSGRAAMLSTAAAIASTRRGPAPGGRGRRRSGLALSPSRRRPRWRPGCRRQRSRIVPPWRARPRPSPQGSQARPAARRPARCGRDGHQRGDIFGFDQFERFNHRSLCSTVTCGPEAAVARLCDERHVVPVHHFGAAGIAQDRLDLAARAADDARGLVRIVGHEAAADDADVQSRIVTASPRAKLPSMRLHADRQQARARAQRPRRAAST